MIMDKFSSLKKIVLFRVVQKISISLGEHAGILFQKENFCLIIKYFLEK